MKKKKIIIIAIIIIIILMLIPVKRQLKDGGSIEYKAILYTVTKVHRIPETEYIEEGYYRYIGTEIEVLGIKLYDNVKLVKETTNIDYLISLKDVNNLITDYLSQENTNLSNYAYNYVDEEKNKVIVGLLENTPEKQNEFLDNVFTNCCGKTYINYLKEHKTIEFKESIEVFEAKIIEVKENAITVSVLKKSGSFRVGNRVTMKITDGVTTSYAVGNRVRITFTGLVLDSDPAQIEATKIELID